MIRNDATDVSRKLLMAENLIFKLKDNAEYLEGRLSDIEREAQEYKDKVDYPFGNDLPSQFKTDFLRLNWDKITLEMLEGLVR